VCFPDTGRKWHSNNDNHKLTVEIADASGRKFVDSTLLQKS
jgi:hypothetical protein